MTTCRRKVLVYGDSLFLKGIAVTLRARMDFDVMETQSALPAHFDPDVLLVDGAQTSFEETDTLLKTFSPTHIPNMVRLDTSGQSLTIYSIHNLPAVDLTDLAQAMEKKRNIRL
jgi:hypothetical protein